MHGLLALRHGASESGLVYNPDVDVQLSLSMGLALAVRHALAIRLAPVLRQAQLPTPLHAPSDPKLCALLAGALG